MNWFVFMVITGGTFVAFPQMISSQTYIDDGKVLAVPIYFKIIMTIVMLIFNLLFWRILGSWLLEDIRLFEDRLLFRGWYGKIRIIRRSAFQGCGVKVTSSGNTRNYLIKTPDGNVEFYETISDVGSLREWLESAGVNWD